MMWQISLSFVTFLFIQYIWKKRRVIKLFRSLNNDLPCSVLGHMHMFIGTDEDRMNAFRSIGKEAIKQGGLTSLLAANYLFTAVADAENAEFILKHCLEKDDLMKFITEVIGNGSIFAPVSIWKPRRKILAPNFSPKNLNHFVNIFVRQSQILVEQLQAVAGSGPFSIFTYINTYSMDSVCENTLGVQINSQINHNQPFLKAFDEGSYLVAKRLCQPWLYRDFIYKLTPYYFELKKHKAVMCDFVDKVIETKRTEMKTRDENNNSNLDDAKTFLEMLIESSGGAHGYSDTELREETLVIVMAGTDTSSVGTSFTAIMLSKHLDVQEKVYQEIKDVFGNSDRPLVAEDLPKLKYLEATIKETLRLCPPVPVIVRKVEQDIVLPSGLTLVKDSGAIILLHSIHRNPKYWGSDAESFRPERFIDTPLKHPAQYMPFSHGPRSCLGYQYAMMSMKTAMASILRAYKILPANPTNLQEPIRVKFQIMMKDVDNFILQLEKRY